MAERFGKIEAMNPVVRLIAAAMLSFMVPVQAGAAACAQICASVAFQHHLGNAMANHASDVSGKDGSVADDTMRGHHCDRTDAPGKCCQGHVVMAQVPSLATAVLVPAFERALFVARWTNFIPEALSPPPIRSSRTA